jgi:hypothetical protein
MPHKTEEIIVGGLLRPWYEPPHDSYVGVREHFSASQLSRLDGLKTKTPITAVDKAFLLGMYAKLLFTADD